MQESENNEGMHIWKQVPEGLLACAGADAVPTHATASSAWTPVDRNKVLVRKECGCLQRLTWKHAKGGSSMCRTCAAAQHTHRGEEQGMLEFVKCFVHEHNAGWWLLREHALHCFSSDTVRYLDCLLIHERVRNCSVDLQTSMLAVELDGSSHGSNPFQFGTDRVVAMFEQEQRDRDKDAELRRRNIRSVRLCDCSAESLILLHEQMDLIAHV